MGNNFEDKLAEALNGEKEMPSVVRESLDSTYNMIRDKSKKKSTVLWKIAIAICFVIISGAIVSNEYVVAGIKAFVHFRDEGIEKAVNEGFVNVGSSSAYDSGIKVTLESYFSDANKMGLSFKLKFDDPNILKEKISNISLQYRIKNGDGEYIIENISDTKPLKGKHCYISTGGFNTYGLDLKNNEISLDQVFESSKGSIPNIENATIEAETVVIIYEAWDRRFIDGTWNLELGKEKTEAIKSTKYLAESNVPDIEIISANSSPTATNIIFTINKQYDEGELFLEGMNMKLIDEDGKEYMTRSYGTEPKDNKTIIYTNFDLSSYENISKFKLIIDGMGEVEFVKS